ncbi:MAG: hypothetical protein IJF92_01080 [Bacilli bacterium]|nr:hypothetical protein [Bacilli bacterium]
MKNDKEYYNYIINFSDDNKAISYKQLKKEITKENKKKCKNHLKLIKSELRHERIYGYEIPTILGVSSVSSIAGFYEGIANNDSDGILIGSLLGCVLLANIGLFLLDSEKEERKKRIENLKYQKRKLKKMYEQDTEKRLESERVFIDSKKPYVKTKNQFK